MKKLALLLPLALVAGLGCLNRGDAPLITTYKPDDRAMMTTTPTDGDYVLYGPKDPSKTDAPVFRVHLRAGEEIGFKKDAVDYLGKPSGAKGSVSAVAGEHAWPLPKPLEQYEWRRISGSSSDNKNSNDYWPRP